jgi:Lipopolysaccharide-assembly
MRSHPLSLSLFLLLLLPLNNGCYSLKGISIDARVNTFFVNTLETVAINAPPTLNIEFTERLKDKIRSETRLQLKTEGADVQFSGKVTDFRVSPVAPKPGETVALNQLTIVISVAAENMMEEKIEWPKEKSFSYFAEFSNSTDLLSVQDQLVRQISDQLLEDIFNHYFNNW